MYLTAMMDYFVCCLNLQAMASAHSLQDAFTEHIMQSDCYPCIMLVHTGVERLWRRGTGNRVVEKV